MMWVGTSYPRIHSTAEDKVGRPQSKQVLSFMTLIYAAIQKFQQEH